MTTAESCTGGWVAKALTDVPGSSAWFQSGFITYANTAKTSVLGVPEALLARHGAVSESVVRRMAQGALRAAGADLAVAVSGIAGPGGGTATKPVGLVWFAIARRAGRRARVHVFSCRFAGDRDAIRRRAVASVLRAVLEP
jgi:nicotinamide-nucleotide amidase